MEILHYLNIGNHWYSANLASHHPPKTLWCRYAHKHEILHDTATCWKACEEFRWHGIGPLPGKTGWVSDYYLCKNIHPLHIADMSVQLLYQPVYSSLVLFIDSL